MYVCMPSLQEVNPKNSYFFIFEIINEARGVGFEPTSSYEHGISNPTPYQARRPPPYHSKSKRFYRIILIVGKSIKYTFEFLTVWYTFNQYLPL
jgi:hypothetical protein